MHAVMLCSRHAVMLCSRHAVMYSFIQFSLHNRVVKKGVSFQRGNVSIITSSDLSDMHVISMNVILPPSQREG